MDSSYNQPGSVYPGKRRSEIHTSWERMPCRHRSDTDPAYGHGAAEGNDRRVSSCWEINKIYGIPADFQRSAGIFFVGLFLFSHMEKFFKIILTHLAKHDILCHKSHWFCGLVWNHPQDVVVFILNTATESGWLSPWDPPLPWGKVHEEFTAPQHTRFILPPIHPTKSIAALHGRYFSFSQIKSYVVVQSSKICF